VTDTTERRGRAARAALALLPAALLATCAGLRSTPETRYRGMVLNARNLGEAQLRTEMARDERIRRHVETEGWPDYIYVAGPDDVELIHYRKSRLAHFRRDPRSGQTTVTELAPLPTPLVNLLEIDLRAGTPGPVSPETPATNCWTVRLPGASCRTCCRGPLRCSTDCKR
jgi:hypothetical protein